MFINRKECSPVAAMRGPAWASLARKGKLKCLTADLVDPLARKQDLYDWVQDHAEDGQVIVELWQMDCDCSSWTSYRAYPASVLVIQRMLDRAYSEAEGPIRYDILRPSDLPEPEDRPQPRDHALEAFEDGHPFHITY